MTPSVVHGKLNVRIFVEERNGEMAWVPYKTLIAYTIKSRPMISCLWEPIYCRQEFASKTEAIEDAKRQAWIRIMELFGHFEEADIQWDMIDARSGRDHT